jgi:hypothetical protein
MYQRMITNLGNRMAVFLFLRNGKNIWQKETSKANEINDGSV